MKDGTVLEEVSMKYPVGHKSRRQEGSESIVSVRQLNFS